MKDLLAKYDLPVPRYTSYPTVPAWESNLETGTWIEHLKKALQPESSSLSLYLHIPFCESLCTFCGCNNIITKNHNLESPYVDHLLREAKLYHQAVPGLSQRPLKHIHLGGGTPTFLAAQELGRLIKGLFEIFSPDKKMMEGSLEIDPRRTSPEQLEILREWGFNRVSLGVQDFDPEVQRLVNRLQSFELTRDSLRQAREMGYESVNFDLIYGLARQTAQSMKQTAEKTLELRPDRIALYSFALVPWIKPAQRLFKDEDLPRAEEKRELYEIAREIFLQAGYLEIGMDHFALPQDGLALAMKEGRLHRNFMGYTDQKTDVLLALGVSGISETPWSFHQNEKVLPRYEELLAQGKIPTFKGHLLTPEDQERRRQILEFVTRYETKLTSEQVPLAAQELLPMIEDGLVEVENSQLRLTTKGKPFLRNAATFFDERLKKMKKGGPLFSKSI